MPKVSASGKFTNNPTPYNKFHYSNKPYAVYAGQCMSDIFIKSPQYNLLCDIRLIICL